MKPLVLLSTIILSGMFLASCAVEPKKSVPQEYKVGQDEFHRVCAGCHGPDAMGGNNAPSFLQEKFLQENLTNGKIARTILNGSDSGAMPSQKSKVTNQQIKQIIKYIRYSQTNAGLSE